METSSIVVMTVILLAALIIGISQKIVIKRYRFLLKCYCDKLYEAYTKEDVMLKYCLNHILKQSVDAEDYETAGKCRELLKKISKKEKAGK